MSNGTLSVIQHVSTNIRQARVAKGWSQEKLAELAGVSRRMLVNIEAGENNASIATVDKLAGALGLTFAEAVRPPMPVPELALPLRIWKGAHTDSHASLMETIPRPGMVFELWHWQLGPGDGYRAEPDAPGCHEMLYVYRGTLEVVLPDRRAMLAAGQALSFASDIPYDYLNAGDDTVAFTKSIIMVPLPQP
ncbi:XRE family transcriptional regulator [uncultured Aquitalea sp.]|uniref:helix-turn-helix domain-containing protein n=1 Tax=uncultured Aquitalea sp. TaxID=540272 RepID=UPI0025D33F79|nr:XRE family transcriptional regulator [uncultured Aquitalea sp.]